MSYQPLSFIYHKDITVIKSLTSGMCLISAFVNSLSTSSHNSKEEQEEGAGTARLTQTKILSKISNYINFMTNEMDVSASSS